MRLFGVRAARVAHFAAVVGRHVAGRVLGPRSRRGAIESEPERLRALLEELGGTFIKFGQMLALQPDILPLEYCNALFNLLDRVAPFSFDEVERMVAEELGASVAEVFDDFEPWPLAAASIGQVHAARLAGEKVAVKVQRPTAEADFAGDVRLMKLAIVLIRRLRLRRLAWMVEPMREFIDWTEEELDYRREARYMEELRRNGRGELCERVPRVVRATRRVLVMEYLDGVTVLDYLRAVERGDEVTLRRLAAMGFDHGRFAGNVIDNFLRQAFAHGLFHADLHPANLMILPGDVVGYLDFGITGGLSPFARRQMLTMTLSHARGELEPMAAALFEVSVMACEAAGEAYLRGMRRLADDWYRLEDGELRLAKSFTLVMLEMLRLSRATGVWPEREVIKYFRSAIAIDGLITRLAPRLDLGRYLEEACARHLLRSAFGADVSTGRLLLWPAASARRMLDGTLRAAAAFDRLVSGELEVCAEVTHRPTAAERDGGTAVAAAALVLALALLMTPDGVRSDLGLNLFTAQLVLMAGGVGTLLGSLRPRNRPVSGKDVSDAYVSQVPE